MRLREFDAHPVGFAAAMARGLWRGMGKGAHDGDTLIVFTDKGMFDYQMVTLRLLGVNAPEMVGTTGGVLIRARTAQQLLERITLERPVLFRTQLSRVGAERMTFDRYLADLWWLEPPDTEHDAAATLLAAGLVDPLPRVTP